MKNLVPAFFLSVVAPTLLAQGLITGLGPSGTGPGPNVTPAVINRDTLNNPVTRIDQIELRPLSTSPGSYHVSCTVMLGSGPTTSLLSGILNLSLTPPLWTPDNHVDALNTVCVPTPGGGQDEFQLTMSFDLLVVAWDNYCGSATTPHTFVCQRANATVAFNPANTMPVNVGGLNLTGGWSDCHLGRALSNGRYEFFYGDPFSPSPRDIARAEVDPTTGALFNVGVVQTRPTGAVWAHSPFVLRDSTGTPRALSFGEGRSGVSNMLWTSNVVNTGVPPNGTPLTIAAAPPGGWFSNGSANGGTLIYGGPPVPYYAEHTLLADTVPRSGPVRIVGWAPIRPAATGPVFVSAVAIGQPVPPYNVPPVLESVLTNYSIGITPALGFHNRFDGIAEWTFTVPPGLPPLVAQMVTIDLSTFLVHASNLAAF